MFKVKVASLLQNIVECYQSLNSVLTATSSHPINYEIMEKVFDLADIAVIPTATVILALFMYSEITEKTLDMQRNGISNNAQISFFISISFSLGISYLIVTYTPQLLLAIVHICDEMLNDVLATSIGTGTSLSIPTVDELGYALYGAGYNENYKIEFTEFLSANVLILVSSLASSIANISVSIVMYSREITLYTLTALSPIALATLPHKEHSHIAKSFIRSYVATALISVVLAINLKVLSLIIYTVPPVSDTSVTAYAGQILLLSIIQITTIFSSATLSKKLVSAM